MLREELRDKKKELEDMMRKEHALKQNSRNQDTQSDVVSYSNKSDQFGFVLYVHLFLPLTSFYSLGTAFLCLCPMYCGRRLTVFVRASRNIVNTISCRVFDAFFDQTYVTDALWDRDECFTIWGQKVKVSVE